MPFFRDSPDCLVWTGNFSSSYSASSGYGWLMSRHQNSINFESWKWVWRLKTPFKICFLVWLIAHEGLLMNIVRCQRGISSFDLCPRCNLYPKTILHCLQDRHHVRSIWELVGLTSALHFMDMIVLDWLKFLALGDKASLFLATLWEVWCHRNGWVLNHLVHRRDVLARKINLLSDTCSMVYDRYPPTKNVISVCWTPPSLGFIKINSDGSSLGNPSVVGFGGILRRGNGDWIMGYSGHISKADNLCAELLGLRRGLILAWNIGFRLGVCEVDCYEIIRLLHASSSEFHIYAPIIRDIQRLLAYNWNCSVHHVYREGNQVADFLTKLGASSVGGEQLWDSPPVGLELILLADVVGVLHLR